MARDEEDRAQKMELVTNSADGDPSTMPRWGWVSARPSEYLIVFRGGRFREELSGQGAQFFKRPSDTIAIVPTTLKEVMFEANQITRDNVDVRVRGMVLYRIQDPLKIYTLVNFSNRQAAEAKLARLIADMCRSTAKWLVANMGLEECIRRRKEDIAVALRAEVAGVVSSQGWGIDLATIDIQDIYIQDEALFASIQAKFKDEKAREAELARLRSEEEVTRRRLTGEADIATQRAAMELQKAKIAADLELAQLEMQRRRDEEKFQLDRFRIEENEKLLRLKLEQELSRKRLEIEAEHERALIEVQRQAALSDERVRALREQLAAEGTASRESLERLFMLEVAPKVAEAVGRSMQNMRYSVMTGGDEAQSPLSFAMRQVIDLLEQRVQPDPGPRPPATRG